jgi:two-component system, OmpR family, sensor histidine kinase KdpD
MVHGNIHPPKRIEAALTHYFRPGDEAVIRRAARLTSST